MYGIIMWYKETEKVGLVWCDDQGALAVLHSSTNLPKGNFLQCGDQVNFSMVERHGIRMVSDVQSIRPNCNNLTVQKLLQKVNRKGSIKVVKAS